MNHALDHSSKLNDLLWYFLRSSGVESAPGEFKYELRP